ncbi:MAG: chemotaxis protein CheA [Chloroflexi bacterium]|nr:chemotaxis protein CheA [Chloroflexota bacterium]
MTLQFDAAPDELVVFLEEAEEQLQLLDQDILVLEKEGPNADLLQEVFRAAHTLKGSSAAIGHERMASLTHAMESVLDCLRKDQLETSTALIDLLLESLDALRALKEEVVTLEHSGIDPSSLVQSLKRFLQQNTPAAEGVSTRGEAKAAGGDAAPPTDAAPQPAGTVLQEGKAYRISVQVAKDSTFPAARFLQVLIALSDIGAIVESSPTREDIEAEKAGYELDILYSTSEDRRWIEELVAAVPEVVAVEVEEVKPEGSAAAEGETPAAGEPSQNAECGDSLPAAGGDGRADGEANLERRSAATTGGVSGNGTAKTVRINIERLDALMNLIGEQVISCTRLVQLGTRLQARYEGDELAQGIGEASVQIQHITDELQDLIMKARMFPVGSVFNRFPRMIRDLAQRGGKKVQFAMEGEETELDRSVIETISDPLIHLLRNAVDHGIEPPEQRVAAGKPEVGQIRLSACHRESRILLIVEDDGRGIDPKRMRQVAVEKGLLPAESAERLSDQEAIEIIFAPGFSTASRVTDVSGRGVGMDVVKTNIRKLNGQVKVESSPGRGTRITVELPLTLAIMDALLVGLDSSIYAIPLASVVETLRVPVSQIHSVNGGKAIQLRGRILPLLGLGHALGWRGNGRYADSSYVVVVGTEDEQVGTLVDSLIGEQQVVIKALGSFIGNIRGLSGATILGDGRVALILDVQALVRGTHQERAGEAVNA